MRPGDRLVCAFIDRLAPGGDFKQWPLHVTIVPWFRLDVPTKELAEELKTAMEGIRPFEARVGRETTMGHDKTVSLILSPDQFEDIEISTRGSLKRRDAWLVDEKTTKQRRRYRPHVTAQQSARVNEGDSFWCDRLYIIEQMGDFKVVAAEITL